MATRRRRITPPLLVLLAVLLVACARAKPPRTVVPPAGQPVAELPVTARPTMQATVALAHTAAPPSPTAVDTLPALPTDSPTATALPTLAPTAAPTETSLPVPHEEVAYQVRPGDTLARIAAVYDTTVDAIMNRNGIITADRINAGQVLIVPLGYAPGTPPPVGRVERVVRAGDTLANLARAYRTTVEDILQSNPGIRDPQQVPAGTVLIIPVGTLSGVRSHEIRAGETLYTIARRYGVTLQALMQANGIDDPDLITPGRALTIP